MNIRLSISSTYQNKKQICNYAKKHILPHLYFRYIKRDLKLLYDHRHSKSFYSLICEIRGYGPCSVQLTESTDQLIHMQVSTIDDALEVPIVILTSKPSLFSETLDHLKRVVEKYLCFIRTSRCLYWQESDNQSFIFLEKEMNSILMNDEYLKEEMDIMLFVDLYTFDVAYDGHNFSFKLLSSRHDIKIIAKYDNDEIEVNSESKSFHLLTDLQSYNPKKDMKTLKRSLELELFFRKIFPKAFICKTKDS